MSSIEEARRAQATGRWRAGVLGIVGGMGTLASAQLLRTIYEQNPGADEQDAPTCLLHSDPAFPDRSEAILAGCDPGISARLVRHLQDLRSAGATRFVLCCVTLHHFLPRVPEDLRARVISLVDLMVDAVARTGEPHLVLCTRGSRHARVLERAPRWREVGDLAVFPEPDDQDAVHELLYRVKAKPVEPSDLRLLDELRSRYGVDSLLGACTETHLLNVALRQQPGPLPFRIEDPLFRLAEGLEDFLHG